MLIATLNVGCSLFGIRNYEMPQYKVILKEDNKEIRYYAPSVIAKTTVQGEFKAAQSTAFRILAGYIFGNNEKKQAIAMTAPVTQKQLAQSEKIQMTAPVTQSPSDAGWVMTFTMPSIYKIEDLPTPKDKRVSIEEAPAHYVAVIEYSWLGSKARNDKAAAELKTWLASHADYEALSAPMFAGYDPPWTLPFFRRNEMMIEVNVKK